MHDLHYFGEKHMDHICSEYLAHYHEERPHQSLENEPIVKPKRRRSKDEADVVPMSDVRCSQRLGGLLKSYRRAA